MALRPLGSLLALASLAGCTLIDLSQLGVGSGAGQTGGESSAGNGPTGGSPAGGNNDGGTSGVTQGGGPQGGAPPGEAYADCLLADDPAIYFRANSPAAAVDEPNLGTLGGVGLFSGADTHSPFPGLIADDDQSTQFFGNLGDGGLTLNGAEALFGDLKPFSVEMWLETPAEIGDTSLLLYQAAGNLLELRLLERFSQDGDETLGFRFLKTNLEERYVTTFLDLQKPPAQLLHVVAVYRQSPATVFAGDGSSDDMLIYVNGVLASDATSGDSVPLPQFTAPLTLGNGFAGLVDEIAIYASELSAADVARHYAFGLNATLGCDGM